MNNPEAHCISDEDSIIDPSSDEDHWLEKDDDNLAGTQHSLSQHLRSPSPTHLPRNSTGVMCVICNEALARSNGPDFSPTCGSRTCAAKLQAATGLPDPSLRRPSGSPNTSSAPQANMFEPRNRVSNSEHMSTAPARNSTSFSPVAMCVICHEALARGNGSDFSTCGRACAAKLQAATGLPDPSLRRTSGSPNTSSAPQANMFEPGNRVSNSRSSKHMSNAPARNSTSVSPVARCVICHEALARGNGSDFSPTCGRTCAAKLQAATGLPDPSLRHTSDRFGSGNWVSSFRPSEATRAYTAITPSYSRPNQIRMCTVCHVRPRYHRGGKAYPTCGLSCAARLHTPGSVEMCDYCKERPKAIANGKMFPQCGNACRDKAKLAEAAATNAAACTSCILCWKSTKSGESDFCSPECVSLADARAPFLIEIPRGHVSFKKVAEFFMSEWRTSTKCPTIKRVYMVVVKPSFTTSFEKYRTKIVGSHWTGMLHRKSAARNRWLVISRECSFGNPGDVEPCSSNKCLLCCIVRSSFRRLDFPSGITTSGLNRTVERYRGGREASSKIAAWAEVVVGREAEMTRRELQDDGPTKPLRNADSVHVIGVRNDGSKLDLDDIVVYDGDAVRPRYLISYE